MIVGSPNKLDKSQVPDIAEFVVLLVTSFIGQNALDI